MSGFTSDLIQCQDLPPNLIKCQDLPPNLIQCQDLSPIEYNVRIYLLFNTLAGFTSKFNTMSGFTVFLIEWNVTILGAIFKFKADCTKYIVQSYFEYLNILTAHVHCTVTGQDLNRNVVPELGTSCHPVPPWGDIGRCKSDNWVNNWVIPYLFE